MTAHANVVEALTAVISEMPAIGKDERAAAQQGGYAYRGIEAITREVQPLFAKHGVVCAPHVQSFDVDHIEVNGKPWTDTRLLISYTVYGPGGTGDFVEVGPIMAIGRDNSDKGANKCMTQAFKYLLLQLLCVSDSKDDGDSERVEADTRRPSEPPPVPPGMVTAKEAYARLCKAYEGSGLAAEAAAEAAKSAWGARGGQRITEADLGELVDAAAGRPFTEATTT